jgi:hypothetical protein
MGASEGVIVVGNDLCPGGDLNPHVLTDTGPSNLRGCHYTTWARDTILSNSTRREDR